MDSKIRFFLGANSHKGFVSYFRQLQEHDDDLQLLILKGGPGSGKSSLMKSVADCAEKVGHRIEYIPCASDPASLDAFIDRSANFAMMDGTSPHVEDPVLPGARQHILYTGDGWDIKKLHHNRRNIGKLNESISECHSSATAYIGAAAELIKENMRVAEKFVDRKKVYSIAEEISGLCGNGECSKETKRLLSAVSVGSTVFFKDTVTSLADKIYVVNDEWGTAADEFISVLSGILRGRGVDYISCRCSVLPERYEHILIPSARIAVVTSNDFHAIESEFEIDGLYGKCKMNGECLKRQSKIKNLINEACVCVNDAKILHDALEAFYVDAMDFSGVKEKYNWIAKSFIELL